MLVVFAHIRVKAGLEQTFIDVFTARRRRVLSEEPLTLQYDIFRNDEDPREFTVIERFESMDGHLAHLKASTDHEPMMACFDGKPVVKFTTGVTGAS
jgi:quinol monooxygenase YgiN